MEKKKSLFKKAVNESSFLKCEIFSFQGGGKTYTAGKMAMGMHDFISSKKPITFIDSEGGSDKLIGIMEAAKIELLVVKTRTFSELVSACREASQISDILIIDSISQYWKELVESYMLKKDLTRMGPHHWIPIKKAWREYTDLYLFSKLHIIACGRSGWRFGYVEEEDGSKQMAAVETKMKAEGEFGYEADLLLEMERIREETGKIGAKNIRRCWVLKDKWDSIDGKHFDNPKFEDFLPHIKHLNLKGKMHSLDPKKDSQDMFKSSGRESGYARMKQRDIFLEEVKQEMIMKFPGRGDDAQQQRIKVLRKIFGTASETAIQNLSVEKIEKGLRELKKIKGGGKDK